MIQSLTLYFQTFLHPSKEFSSEEKISYFEVLGISWSLHLIYAFYSIFAIYLGILSYEYLSSSADFTHMLFESVNVSFQKIGMMITLFEVVFYPFLFQFGFKFWSYILKFYTQIFDYDGEKEAEILIEDLLNTSFTANIFLMIPIFGNVLSTIGQTYYLFLGLKSKLKFSTTQAILVLMTPLFLIFLLTILIASYFTLLISLI